MAKALVVIAVLLIAGLVGVGLFYEPENNQSLLESARKNWVNGDAKEANRLFRQYLEANPNDDVTRVEWAKLIADTDSESALDLIDEVAEDGESGLAAAREMGRLGLMYGDNQRAEAGFIRMAKAEPENYGPVLALAELYFKMERFEESLPLAEQAAKLKSDRAQTWLLIVDNLAALGREGELTDPLLKALELEPENYVANANLSHAFQVAGDLESAEKHAKWCLDRNTNDVNVRRILARIEMDLGKTNEALITIREATRIAPKDVEARVIEAQLLLFLKQSQEAYDALIPLLDAHPFNRPYLSTLSRAAVGCGKRDEAIKYQQKLRDALERLNSSKADGVEIEKKSSAEDSTSDSNLDKGDSP